jgi:preprotein translocase subunit SecB
MANASKYPYEALNIFAISLSFKRNNSIPENIEIPISTEIKVVEPGFPRLQVNMRVKTPPDSPFSFNIETVGLFDYVGEKGEYDKELNKEFVTEKALHILWIYASQLVRIITGQMGTNPINIKTPLAFSELREIQKNETTEKSAP